MGEKMVLVPELRLVCKHCKMEPVENKTLFDASILECSCTNYMLPKAFKFYYDNHNVRMIKKMFRNKGYKVYWREVI